MKIGILGGTFNPIHNGHLYIAGEVLKKLKLNKVLFIPTYIPPHKKIKESVKAIDRLCMVRLALKGKKKFNTSYYEIKKRGTSYSIKTAHFLKRRYGKNSKLYFIIGSDSLRGLKKWKDIGKLSCIVSFVVVPRRGCKKDTGFKKAIRLNIPKKDISSTQIRRMIREDKSIRGMVPSKVMSYIERKRLYIT